MRIKFFELPYRINRVARTELCFQIRNDNARMNK